MNHSITAPLPRNQHFGISVVELMVALGLIAVLFSFGSPVLSNAVARAELRAAAENMELSIDVARDAARRYESKVVMHLPPAAEPGANRVTYSSPDQRVDFATLAEFEFPSSVRVVASAAEIRFDHRGVAEAPVQVELVSVDDTDLKHLIVVD